MLKKVIFWDKSENFENFEKSENYNFLEKHENLGQSE